MTGVYCNAAPTLRKCITLLDVGCAGLLLSISTTLADQDMAISLRQVEEQVLDYGMISTHSKDNLNCQNIYLFRLMVVHPLIYAVSGHASSLFLCWYRQGTHLDAPVRARSLAG